MSDYKFEPNPNDHELIAFLKEQEDKEKGIEQPKQPKSNLTPEQKFIKLLISTRINRNLSQTVLAQRTGIPQSALARIEAGKVSPTLKTLTRLAEAMDMEIKLLRKPR